MSASTPKVTEIFEQRYQLLEQLGSGGIGTVFRARQIDADRLIALKVLHPNFAEDEEFKTRFLREAQSLNKLHHPNIVTLYHLGLSEDGVPYLAMELIEGITLRNLLASEQKLKPARAIAITKQLCSALAAMHADGIIHRDLKPENIVLMQDPEPDFVKIIDFGLVRIEGESDKQKLTSTGFLVGSVNYMSPEQCRGLKVDARSDIYAIAVCFYEMLAGRCPFEADSPVGVMYKHTNENAPLVDSTTVNNYHPSINELLQKGMHKDPACRYQSTEELSEVLDKLSDTISGAEPWREPGKPHFLVLLPLCLALLASALAFNYFRSEKSKEKKDIISIRTKQTHLRIRSRNDIELLNEPELEELISERDANISLRIEACLRLAFNARSSQKGLAAAKKARQLYLDERNKTRNEELADRVSVAEAETLVGNRKFEEALPILRRLCAQHDGTHRIQDIFKAKALAAVAHTRLQQPELAIPYLKEICEWQYGMSYPAIIYALNCAFELDRLDIAKCLANQSTKLAVSAQMASTCRINGHPELADDCLQHGIGLRKDIELMNVQMSDNLSIAELHFDLEHCWSDIYHKRHVQVKKFLERVLGNQHILAVLKPHLYLETALLLREAKMYLQALEFLKDNKSVVASCLRADIYVLQRDFEAASRCIGMDASIFDPDTKEWRPAMERLKDLKGGKLDYRKGLNDWNRWLKPDLL